MSRFLEIFGCKYNADQTISKPFSTVFCLTISQILLAQSKAERIESVNESTYIRNLFQEQEVNWKIIVV
jgi:hypothetical protein